MKRRLFVKSASGVVASQALALPLARAQAASPHALERTSRLFGAGAAAERRVVQDIVFGDDLIYSLWSNGSNGQWSITGMTPLGDEVLQLTLPKGVYLGLGISGATFVVHALTYYDRNQRPNPHCVLRLAADGSSEVVASLGKNFQGRFFFVGDTHLLRVCRNIVDLWNISKSSLTSRGITLSLPLRSDPHVDMLTPKLAALTPIDGSQIATVDIDSGSLQVRSVLVSEVSSAISHYAKQTGSGTGEPVVIPATGSDHGGWLYALVLPSPRSAVQTVKIDSSGNGSGRLTLQFPPRQAGISGVPIKLIVRNSELGVVYSDGAIGWYSI